MANNFKQAITSRLDQDPINPVRPSLKHPFFNNPIPLTIDAVL